MNKDIRQDMGQAAAQSAEAHTVQDVGRDTRHVRVRRVGSLTFGIALVCYGILFLIRIFMPVLPYRFIFRCWPVIFILLGVEILAENHRCRQEQWKMVYDFPAVLMLGVMLLFAMVMALIEYAMAYGTICL